MTRRWRGGLLLLTGLSLVACAIGLAVEGGGRFCAAWLCAYLFWLGVPLGALTLVLAHDLTGGGWMESARPAVNAAIATMPLATLAGTPAILGLHAIYTWANGAPLGNGFYLNTPFFIARFILDLAMWNGLAAYALWGPRAGAVGIAPSLSWLSGIGLLLLAYTASFAAIDWVLSLDPHFWSAIFPMIAGSAWFNTGLAVVVIAVACTVRSEEARGDMRDIAALLLAMVIFWGYAEFCQFLIIWEEDLAAEIPWYLHRIAGGWRVVTWLIAIFGFAVPFCLLLSGRAKRNRGVVIAACGAILIGRVLHSWWLVLPEVAAPPPWWLDLAAMATLGGGVVLLFLWRLHCGAGVSRLPEAAGAR